MNSDIEEITEFASSVIETGIAGSLAMLDGGGYVSTVDIKSGEDALAMLKSVTNAERLKDHVGEVIKLSDWFAQPVDVVDEDGGTATVIRMVLIDDKGHAFAATSVGVLTAIKNIVSVVGKPRSENWPKQGFVPVVARMRAGRNGYDFMTLEVA